MPNLTDEQKLDCQERIDKANEEIKLICEKYSVEPVITDIKLAMGDIKYREILSPIQL